MINEDSTQHRRRFALLVIAAALLWSLLASWFSAHLIIGYYLEMESYALCFVTVFCGVILFLYTSATPQQYMIVVGEICSLIIVVSSCEYSDDTFMYWKKRQIPPQVWQKMASDLKAAGKEIPIDTRPLIFSDVNMSRLPKSLEVLGMRKDYLGFYSGTEPLIVYGSRGRQWGLVIGSNYIFGANPKSVMQVRVADDAYFFVDPTD